MLVVLVSVNFKSHLKSRLHKSQKSQKKSQKSRLQKSQKSQKKSQKSQKKSQKSQGNEVADSVSRNQSIEKRDYLN